MNLEIRSEDKQGKKRQKGIRIGAGVLPPCPTHTYSIIVTLCAALSSPEQLRAAPSISKQLRVAPNNPCDRAPFLLYVTSVIAGGAPVVSRRNVASHEKVTPTEAVLGLRRVGGGCCLLVRERIRFTPTQYGDSVGRRMSL